MTAIAAENKSAANRGLERPLTQREQELIDEFLELRQAYRAITRRIETELCESLDHYQQQRHFYQDVSDLTHFRLNFFDTVGYFLRNSFETTYQLELWDRQSHRKFSFDFEVLADADRCQLSRGTAVETLNYSRLGVRVRRTFDIQNKHLYRAKTQIFLAGKPVELVDGLMHLQRELEDHTLWLKGSLLQIRDFT